MFIGKYYDYDRVSESKIALPWLITLNFDYLSMAPFCLLKYFAEYSAYNRKSFGRVTAQKMKPETADLVSLTEKILNGKL